MVLRLKTRESRSSPGLPRRDYEMTSSGSMLCIVFPSSQCSSRHRSEFSLRRCFRLCGADAAPGNCERCACNPDGLGFVYVGVTRVQFRRSGCCSHARRSKCRPRVRRSRAGRPPFRRQTSTIFSAARSRGLIPQAPRRRCSPWAASGAPSASSGSSDPAYGSRRWATRRASRPIRPTRKCARGGRGTRKRCWWSTIPRF